MTNEDEYTPTSFLKFFFRILKALLSGGQPFLLVLFSLNLSAQMKVDLNEVEVKSKAYVEKKFGLKKRTPGIHLIDGILDQKKNFEFSQSIQLPARACKITSANLYISNGRKDSAFFRLHFYKANTSRPGDQLFKESITFKAPVKEGWLKLDLKPYNIHLAGTCFAGIECLNEIVPAQRLDLEVKLGGSIRTFLREEGEDWQQAPHHYLFYITALVPENWQEEPEADKAANHQLYSKQIRDSFSIFVSLPPRYNQKKKYPVIYLLDANAYFEALTIHATDSALLKRSEVIVVGIGYKTAYLMDSLRMRDYTWPEPQPSDSCTQCGNGAAFYSFIQTELIPFIDSLYSCSKSNRSLAGHSLGGYFCLYAFFRDRQGSAPLFQNYIAISPHMRYSNSYLLNRLKGLQSSNPTNKSRVFLAYGGKELSDPEDSGYDQQLSSTLGALPFVNYRHAIIPQASHMEAAIPGFEQGLKQVGFR